MTSPAMFKAASYSFNTCSRCAELCSKSDLANCRTAGSESMNRRGLYGSSCQVCTSPFFTASSRRRTRSEPPLRSVLVASARTVALMPFHLASNNAPTLGPHGAKRLHGGDLDRVGLLGVQQAFQ